MAFVTCAFPRRFAPKESLRTLSAARISFDGSTRFRFSSIGVKSVDPGGVGVDTFFESSKATPPLLLSRVFFLTTFLSGVDNLSSVFGYIFLSAGGVGALGINEDVFDVAGLFDLEVVEVVVEVFFFGTGLSFGMRLLFSYGDCDRWCGEETLRTPAGGVAGCGGGVPTSPPLDDFLRPGELLLIVDFDLCIITGLLGLDSMDKFPMEFAFLSR